MPKFYLILIATIAISCGVKTDTEATKEPAHKISSLLDSSYVSSSSTEKITAKIDSVKIRELAAKVSEKIDEYKGITWVKPKDAPNYYSTNAAYFYFGKMNGKPLSLRFVIQYYSKDWLFIKFYRFVVDGKLYSLIPDDIKRDNGYGGKIWEWCDESIDGSNEDLVKALANATTAKIRLEGTQYYDERILSKKQLESLKNIYELYIASGGELD